MARPTKTGLDYYSFDVNFFSNRKIRKIMRACGPSSPTILICLLCNIYEYKGYYIEWDEELPFDIADDVGVSEGAVKEVMKKAIDIEFFDKEMYEKFKILTSKGIQERFVEGTRKRKDISVKKEYWIISDINPVSTVKNSIDVSSNKQSKVNQSKEKTPSKSASKEGGKTFLNLIDKNPPNDGIPRNWDGLRNFMVKYGIKGHEADEIIILSNFGQTSVDPNPPMPIWSLKMEVEKSNGKIRLPGAFILSRLRTQAN